MREGRRPWTWLTLGIPAVLAGVLVVFSPTNTAVTLLLATAVVTFAILSPFFGWILVVLTYPFIDLQVPIGATMHAPIVDLLAIGTSVGWFVRAVVRWWRTGRFPEIPTLPGAAALFAFLAVGALSLVNAPDPALSAKYLLRPLAFFYPMYVLLPLLVVDSPRRLFATFRAMVVVGVVVAAMGAWSLIVPPEPGVFRRAVPVSVFGIAPLGTNHNLIAEVLVSVIPVGVILALLAGGRSRRWYAIGTAAFALITLLTFSRTGWIALAAEGAVLGIALARSRRWSWARIARRFAPIPVLVTIAVLALSFTAIVESSNRNRLQLTAIAIEQFRSHPFVGGGVGSFMEAVRRNRWYLGDFGNPQEAHGILQKLVAETGALGMIAYAWLLAAVIHVILRAERRSEANPEWRLILLALLCASAGSMTFQLFQTSYFVSKLWLPLGVALVGARLAEEGMRMRTVER